MACGLDCLGLGYHCSDVPVSREGRWLLPPHTMAETARTRTRTATHPHGDGNVDKCTCFVRRVPQDVKEDEILELFGAVGPVKKAFIVQEKGEENHKGYAFVTFALAEDAKKAVQKLANHSLKGSRLKVRNTQPLFSSQLKRVAGTSELNTLQYAVHEKHVPCRLSKHRGECLLPNATRVETEIRKIRKVCITHDCFGVWISVGNSYVRRKCWFSPNVVCRPEAPSRVDEPRAEGRILQSCCSWRHVK